LPPLQVEMAQLVAQAVDVSGVREVPKGPLGDSRDMEQVALWPMALLATPAVWLAEE
jgi:hypothetical protein